MSKLVVVMFSDAAMTHKVIGALKKLRAERTIRLYASTVVARDASGKLSVQEVTKEGLGGTAVGALIGALAGLPLGPLAVTIGAAGGALIGGSADLTQEGADTEFVEKVSRELAPGKAAVVAEVDDDGSVAFEALMKSLGGTVVRK
ncbi:MAG: DUF1269 domain-containing protein [Steroidobacteraceae bacterium]